MIAVESARVGEHVSPCASDRDRLVAANVNPLTGLSTDYLNHFNEAIMLLEMMPQMPECRDDLAAWRPLSYREHFAKSHLRHRELTLAAYDRAHPLTRRPFDALCETMNAAVLAARKAIQPQVAPEQAAIIAERAAAALKPLLARAGAIIHGVKADASAPTPLTESQALVDAILNP
jgi:hypothetical protein